MSEEEKKAIEIVKEITFVRGIRKDVEGEEEDLFALEKSLNLIDRLQKENEELKEGLNFRVNYCKKLEQELYSEDFEETLVEKKIFCQL